MNRLLLYLSLILIISACGKRTTVYNQYKEIPSKGWDKDSAAHFDVTLEKETPFSVLINIRNRNDYKSQNMWLFVNYQTPEKKIIKDTLNFYLADNQGRWLGSGFGSLHEMQVVYLPKVKFPTSGTYTFEIKHGMRDSSLVGINDIGLEILTD